MRASETELNREALVVLQRANLRSGIYGDIQCFMDSRVNFSLIDP